MLNTPFDFGRISESDRDIASRYIGSLYRPPDLVIAPADHGEYLFRWYVIQQNADANVYFHIQTASDPERPLHDHPWDSTSAILSNGYDEIINEYPFIESSTSHIETRLPGQCIFRPSTWAHRLILPAHIPYSMSLFSTGPKVRDWGFWTEQGFRSWKDITIESEGHSTWDKEKLK